MAVPSHSGFQPGFTTAEMQHDNAVTMSQGLPSPARLSDLAGMAGRLTAELAGRMVVEQAASHSWMSDDVIDCMFSLSDEGADRTRTWPE